MQTKVMELVLMTAEESLNFIFHFKKKKTATEERVANLRKHTTQILLLSVLKDHIIFQKTWRLFLKRAHHSGRSSLFNVMET